MQKGLDELAVQGVHAKLGQGQVDVSASQGEERRPPCLRRPLGHDQDCRGTLAGDLAKNIWNEGPRRVDPNSLLLLPVERESIELWKAKAAGS